MKQTFTFLLLLAAILWPNSAAAQTQLTYTDSEGLKWYCVLNGTDATIDFYITGKRSPEGPSIVQSSSTPIHYAYQGDVLRIPSTVSDGTNTYTVRRIATFAIKKLVKAEKVIIPATITQVDDESFFHTNFRRIVFEEGSQFTTLHHSSFGGVAFMDYENPLRAILYYDFTNAPITTFTANPFFSLNNNALLFYAAASFSTSDFAPNERRTADFLGTDNIILAGVCNSFHLDDAEEFESPHAFTALQASYNRIFSNTAGKAVSTLYLPYPTDLPTGMQAYTLTQKDVDENGDKAFCFAPIPLGTRLEAYKPYLVRITDGQSHTLPVMHNVTVPATPKTEATSVEATNDSDWKFYGTTMYIDNPEASAQKAYYLSGNKWWAVQNGVTNDYIAPYRCFIASPTGAVPAKSFVMLLEDETNSTVAGIRNLERDTETDIKSGRYMFYSIDGRQLGKDYNALVRGQIYVVNGKKFYKF